jgi:hypothetical protein
LLWTKVWTENRTRERFMGWNSSLSSWRHHDRKPCYIQKVWQWFDLKRGAVIKNFSKSEWKSIRFIMWCNFVKIQHNPCNTARFKPIPRRNLENNIKMELKYTVLTV